MNNSASCTILFLSFMPNNPSIHPLFSPPSLKKLKGKMTVSEQNSEYSEFTTFSVGSVSVEDESCCLSWISIEIWEFIYATVSEALGVGLCVSRTLPWNLDEWWANGDFGIHPYRLLSLQEQSGFTGCSYRAQAIFICPDFLLFLPVLSKFPCRNGAIGFPKISSCRFQVGWQLSFQDFCFPGAVNPTLGW